jgi:transposase-like protein
MAPKETNANRVDWKSELLAGGDVVRELFRDVLQEVLEAEMAETLQAKPGERTSERLGLRSGSYSRTRSRAWGSSIYACRRIGRDGLVQRPANGCPVSSGARE